MLGYTCTRWVDTKVYYRYFYIQTGLADIVINIVNVWFLAWITSNKTRNYAYVLLFSWIQIMGHT